MQYLYYGLAALAAVIVLFVVIVALQPSKFQITRSATMSAPAATIFPHINDFHLWNAWSPWAKLDLTTVETFAGPPAGVGASMACDSKSNKVGAGKMTLVETRPNGQLNIQLDFLRPMQCTNAVEFTLKPAGDKTLVTWNMTGTNNFMGKAFCLLMNMDKMVGKDFEKGLANMQAIVEGKK